MKSGSCFQLYLLLLFSSTIFSGEVTDALPQTGGNRAFAMGGTCIASNQGINALFGNPAGLSVSNNSEIIIGHYWQIHKTSQFDDQYHLRWKDSYSIKYKQIHKLNYLGLLYLKQLSQFPLKFAGAIGLSPFYNWTSTRIYKWEDSYVTGNNVIRYSSNETEEKIDGLYDLFSIGIGISREEIGAIGVSVNYPVRNHYEYESHTVYVSKRNGEQDIYEDDYKYIEDISAGHFFRIGGILHLIPGLSLGFLWMEDHYYTIRHQNRNFPATVNFGITYKIWPDLLFAFDIQNRPWEKIKIDDEYISNAKNGNSYRFGLEYENIITMRTGYAYDVLPITDPDDHVANLNEITFGIGYSTKYFVLDIGTRYRFTTFKAENWADIYDYHINDLVLQSTLKLII